jgi:DNA-directed RNA polymerase subunit alpha
MELDHQRKESLMEVENVNVKNWKSLIKPSKLDVQISDDLTHAKIIA